MKRNTWATATLLFLSFVVVAGCSEPTAVPVTLLILTEDGRPLEGAAVGIGAFTGVKDDPQNKRRIETPATGSVETTVRTFGEISYVASKPGFYTTRLRGLYVLPLKGLRYPVQTMPITVVLRPQLDPIPLYARRFHALELPELDSELPFDLQRADWLPPHGKGEVGDIVFHGRKYISAPGVHRAELALRFTSPMAGVQSAAVLPGSALRLPHHAPIDGYDPELIKWEESTGTAPAGSNFLHENGAHYFFRTRTRVDDNGRLRTAHYGKLYDDVKIFWQETDTMKVQFMYYWNPKPNDTNLEFDPRSNLFGKLPPLEEVRYP